MKRGTRAAGEVKTAGALAAGVAVLEAGVAVFCKRVKASYASKSQISEHNQIQFNSNEIGCNERHSVVFARKALVHGLPYVTALSYDGIN